MSSVGYIRYKLNPLTEGTYQIPFYKNGVIDVTHTVVIKKRCSTEKLIKYLDKNGQYRFYPFNSRYETRDAPKLIGKTNKIVASILESQTSESNLGYKNTRSMALVADNVSDDELEYLQDIWKSPRVYLYVGITDLDRDWVQVDVSGGDTISRRRKSTNGKLNLTVTLPEYYTITKL